MKVDIEKISALEDIKDECMVIGVEEEAVTEAEAEAEVEGGAEVEDVVEPVGGGGDVAV